MPPVRGRELKLILPPDFGFLARDAPCAGARIETIIQLKGKSNVLDAPCAGARIETMVEAFSVDTAIRCPLCGGEN